MKPTFKGIQHKQFMAWFNEQNQSVKNLTVGDAMDKMRREIEQGNNSTDTKRIANALESIASSLETMRKYGVKVYHQEVG